MRDGRFGVAAKSVRQVLTSMGILARFIQEYAHSGHREDGGIFLPFASFL